MGLKSVKRSLPCHVYRTRGTIPRSPAKYVDGTEYDSHLKSSSIILRGLNVRRTSPAVLQISSLTSISFALESMGNAITSKSRFSQPSCIVLWFVSTISGSFSKRNLRPFHLCKAHSRYLSRKSSRS